MGGVAGIATLVMGCAEPSGPNVKVTDFGGPVAVITDAIRGVDGFDYPTGMTAGEVRVCKRIPAGDPNQTFTFQVTAVSVLPAAGAISDVQHQINGVAGTEVCTDVFLSAKPGSGLDQVTIVEGAVANWAVTAINTLRIDDGPGYDPPDPVADNPNLIDGNSVTENVAGRTSVVFINGDMGRIVTFVNDHTAPAAGAVLLIIDEDGIDPGLHFNDEGGTLQAPGLITPNGPDFFKPDGAQGVNENNAFKGQRGVLPYFANNIGRIITVKTGKTDDEAWFAPACIPAKMNGSDKDDNTCLTNGARETAIDNFMGVNGPGAIPNEERLDKIPYLIPLRSLGLTALVDRLVCALVYDSDVPTNYDHDKVPPNVPARDQLGVNGSFKGETYGIVAFTVLSTHTLNGFSSSTLPQVRIRIENTNLCGTWVLFRAPVPKSSSVPNDRLVPPSTAGYKFPNQPPVFF